MRFTLISLLQLLILIWPWPTSLKLKINELARINFCWRKKVLIIESIEDLTDEQRPVKKFFFNDLALTRSIYKSIIGKASIDISININRKLVIVEFEPDIIN